MREAIEEAHVSFASGHASFIFQAATFLAIYLQARLSSDSDGLDSSYLGKKHKIKLDFSCEMSKL